MAQRANRSAKRYRLPRSVLWGFGLLAVASVAVQVSRTGIDVLLLLVIGFAIVLLERTVGDWMGELIGSGLTTVVLAALLGMLAWICFAPGGVAERLFLAAQRQGYHTLYRRPVAVGPPGALSPSGGGPGVPASRVNEIASGSRPASKGTAGVASTAGTENGDAAEAAPAQRFVDRIRAGRPRVLSVTRVQAPDLAVTGEEIVLRVHVTADGQSVAGARVALTLNGRALGTRITGPDGSASISLTARAPGPLHVSAHVASGDQYLGSSSGARITVLPGR